MQSVGRGDRPGTPRRRRKVPKKIIPVALALLAALVGVFWARPSEAHVKSILLVSEVLPQVPVKPLSALTERPVHKTLALTPPGR